MNLKAVYLFDSVTREYLGFAELDASSLSPEGVWKIPENCLEHGPGGRCDANHRIVERYGKWVVEPLPPRPQLAPVHFYPSGPIQHSTSHAPSGDK